MEFSDDVLGLIWAFSKPCFREFRLFNRAKMVLGNQWPDLAWPKLKEVLQTDASVIPLLNSYLHAVVYRQEVRHTLHDHVTKLVFKKSDYDDRIRLSDLLWDSRHREHQLYRVLIKKIYGVSCYDNELTSYLS